MIGERKLIMMKLSYASVVSITFLYLLIMASVNEAPESIVMMMIFAALGGGHASANFANAAEHNSKKPG